LHLAVDRFSVLIDSMVGGPMMSDELALMPRSAAPQFEFQRTYAIKATTIPTAAPSANRPMTSLLVIAKHQTKALCAP
jgi:hypothetical protein